MTDTSPVQFEPLLPKLMQTLASAHGMLSREPLESMLVHLVHLRASQINQCAYCVKLHVKEALEAGEKQERLDRLLVWRRVSDFSARERAALAWTEVLTTLPPDVSHAEQRGLLRELFSEHELATLTSEIIMINVWNRIHVSGY